jgi:hypothetical protein
MAIILPGADWQPYSGKSTTPVHHDILCAHTIVGGVNGAVSGGSKAGTPYAHNYVRCSGTTVQVQDLAYRAAANLYGNPYVLSWETEDMNSSCWPNWGTSCGNVPAWSDHQVERLIKDMAWCCIRWDIPPVLISNTKAGTRGLGYHRMGVPGSPEWVEGNLAWTKSKGKCCPDWRRIAQFKTEVVPGVKALVNGLPPKPPEPVRIILEDDMPIQYGAKGRPPRLAIGGTSIGWDSNTRRERVLKAMEAAKIQVPTITLTPEDYDYLAKALVTETDIQKILDAASSTQLAETMVNAAEFKKQIAPGGFLNATLIAAIKEGVKQATTP